MRKKDYIPTNDEKFLLWVKNLFDYAKAHEAAWKIDPEVWSKISPLLNAYDDALKKAQDPNHGSADVLVKNETRDALKKAIRQFVKEYVEYNHFVTDEDRKHMDLPIHDTQPTPKKKLHQRIVIEGKVSNNGQHTVSTLNQETGKKNKPDEADGVRFAWGVMPAAPNEAGELPNSIFSRKTSQVLDFEEKYRGLTAYYAARYENLKGEAGPWSDIIALLIP